MKDKQQLFPVRYLSLFVMTLLLGSVNLSAQSAHKLLRDGDEKYLQNDYKGAEEDYRKALQRKPSASGQYNLGNSIYNQQRYDEAVRQYESAASTSADDLTRSEAYYNLGNAHLKNNQFEKSIDAYKNSLRLNAADQDAKYNLSYAKKMLQQQQQQQQQQDQQKEEDKKDDQEQQQQQQDQQDQQNQQDQQQQQEQKDQQDQQNQQSAEAQEKDLSKEEAENLLQIMADEERKVQEKMRKEKAGQSKSSKDW